MTKKADIQSLINIYNIRLKLAREKLYKCQDLTELIHHRKITNIYRCILKDLIKIC